jgi:hypothetical protein
MAGENDSGTVNPLDPGTDPHSVESAAADFTNWLNEGDAPEKPKRERAAPAEKAAPAADTEESQPERQPKRERAVPQDDPDDGDDDVDPILGGDEPTEDNEDDDGPDDTEDDPDSDDDDPDGDGEDGEEDPEKEILQAKIKITVNGEESEITVDEARNGYMRDADYRQKTERNAREYDEIVAYADETVTARQQADAAIREALALVEAMTPSEEDWAALKANNPQGYITAQEHLDGLRKKAADLVKAQHTLVGDAGKDTTRRDAKYHQEQERKLQEKLPLLREERHATRFRKEVMEYGLKAGYTEAEMIEGAVDHRDLITLFKAAQFDKIQAAKKAGGRKARQNAPRTSAETKAPGARPNRENRRSAQRSADRRLERSGSVHDAADAFAEMIRRGA